MRTEFDDVGYDNLEYENVRSEHFGFKDPVSRTGD